MNIVFSKNAELCAAIHEACFPNPWTEESFSSLLASSGIEARVIDTRAFLLTRSVASEMEILTLAVKPEAQRQGYALALMQHALGNAKQQGIHMCFLEVDKQNKAAIHCYEKLGFQTISIREKYYKNAGGFSDALLMRYDFKS